MQQNPVDDAEQCGIGANPKRQHRNYNQRKPEIFPKAPHGSSLPSGTEELKNRKTEEPARTKEPSNQRTEFCPIGENLATPYYRLKQS
jgi:hypothetical protein